MRWKPPAPGFTLIETVISAAMAATVMTGVFMTIGNVYFTQKKISVRQNFASETRFLMERTLRMIRDNTLDYDRLFVELGPDTTACPAFDVNQIPRHLQSDYPEYTALPNYQNIASTRAAIGYENVFMWNTSTNPLSTEIKIPNRTLGGLSLFDIDSNGKIDDPDPCSAAFPSGPLSTIFLINNARNIRYGLRFNNGKLELQTQVGVDIDKNGIIDIWGPVDANENGSFTDYEEGDVLVSWNDVSGCSVRAWNDKRSVSISYAMDYNNSSDEMHEYCFLAHDWTPIALSSINIQNFWVMPAPLRDPYLAFRSDDDQQHPHVQIHLETELDKPERYGFAVTPALSLQTTVSSRVFGNTRQ